MHRGALGFALVAACAHSLAGCGGSSGGGDSGPSASPDMSDAEGPSEAGAGDSALPGDAGGGAPLYGDAGPFDDAAVGALAGTWNFTLTETLSGCMLFMSDNGELPPMVPSVDFVLGPSGNLSASIAGCSPVTLATVADPANFVASMGAGMTMKCTTALGTSGKAVASSYTSLSVTIPRSGGPASFAASGTASLTGNGTPDTCHCDLRGPGTKY